jgi:hypothetical protein
VALVAQKLTITMEYHKQKASSLPWQHETNISPAPCKDTSLPWQHEPMFRQHHVTSFIGTMEVMEHNQKL